MRKSLRPTAVHKLKSFFDDRQADTVVRTSVTEVVLLVELPTEKGNVWTIKTRRSS